MQDKNIDGEFRPVIKGLERITITNNDVQSVKSIMESSEGEIDVKSIP
jgi:hypothetical protein